jgi:hypothetical protein
MLVNYTLIFVTLILFAGLAVDAGLLEQNYLQLQTGAKAAAVGASVTLQRTGSSSSAINAGQAAATANGFTNGANGVAVTITITPISSSYSSTISATITESIPPTFLGILGMGTVNMQAKASTNEAVPVNLTSYYNVIAIYTDGHAIPNGGGFDSGYAFSANLLGLVRESNSLGAILSWRGQIFALAQANSANGVSQTTVQLPHARPYSQLLILAGTAWAYSSTFSGTFVVTYSDGSTATSNFNMSDWCVPEYYGGETMVSGQAYRDYDPSGTPTQDPRQNYTYGYTINVDNTKTLSTLKLPTQRNVVVFAIDVVP